MRLVLMTALGSLVEPLVNRNLTMVSGPVAAMALSTASVTGVAHSSTKLLIWRPSTPPSAITMSMSSPTVAAIALA